MVWVHSPTTSVHEGRLLRLTIPFKNGFPFVGQWAAEVEMKKYVAALQVHATKAEHQLGSRDRKRTRTSGPAAAGVIFNKYNFKPTENINTFLQNKVGFYIYFTNLID